MMIDPSAVAFDIDDVFANTMSLFLQIAREEYNLDGIRHEDITSYMVEECVDIEASVLEAIFSRILDGSRVSALKPMKDASGVLTRLGKDYAPVVFVTARPHLDSIVDWVRAYLPIDQASIEIIATGSFDGKADVLLSKGISYFVDDRLETCFTLEDAGVTPILFKQPWNRKKHPFMEVGSWRELEALIEFDGNKK